MKQRSAKVPRSPSTLLLGGGYALSRLGRGLAPGSFVITTTSQVKLRIFEERGWLAALVDLDDEGSVQELFTRYPDIREIIDSVPPISDGAARGVEQLLRLLPSKVERIFYLSSTGVYGKNDGSVVTEETSCTPIGSQPVARLKVEEAYRSSAVQTTVFRLGGLYGPGRGVGLSMRNGTYRMVEGLNRYTNRIHVEDLVGALLAALKRKEKLPPILNLTDDEPAPSDEVVQYYRERFDIPEPIIISRAEAERLENHRLVLNQRVSNALLKRTLGYSFTYPSFREGAGTEFESAELL